MPYEVTQDHRACPASKPWAVVKRGDRGEPLGCHSSEEKAKQQVSALYANEERGQSWTPAFTRSFPLEDIRIRSGDGRTVEAYAAVFDTPAEVRDQDGHYMETIARSAFNKTISERSSQVGVVGVFYNHGMTIHGTPSERGSMPIGTPEEIRSDSRGLFTVTRYNRTELADEVLESIRAGSITGQSFSGRVIQSNPQRVPRRGRSGELPQVTRTEIALREYGPTPFPAYQEAAVLGMRSIIDQFHDLDEDERAEVSRMLASTTPSEPETRSDTPEEGAVTDEPAAGHSGPVMSRANARARLLKRGVLLP